jgi:hypothetical protein
VAPDRPRGGDAEACSDAYLLVSTASYVVCCLCHLCAEKKNYILNKTFWEAVKFTSESVGLNVQCPGFVSWYRRSRLRLSDDPWLGDDNYILTTIIGEADPHCPSDTMGS